MHRIKKILKKFNIVLMFLVLLSPVFGERIECPDGSMYEGTLKNGVFDGYGEQYWNENVYYKGNYVNGKFDGNGLFVNSEISYEGEFSDGEYNGTGVLTSNSGYKYIGSFEHNLFNGTGYILYQNGDSYKGDFKDGYFNGYGTYKYADGKIENGIFENGNFYDPSKKVKSVLGIIFGIAAIISMCANVYFLIQLKKRNN